MDAGTDNDLTVNDRIVAETADLQPKSLADLLADYDAADLNARLSQWNSGAPAGQEAF